MITLLKISLTVNGALLILWLIELIVRRGREWELEQERKELELERRRNFELRWEKR